MLTVFRVNKISLVQVLLAEFILPEVTSDANNLNKTESSTSEIHVAKIYSNKDLLLWCTLVKCI